MTLVIFGNEIVSSKERIRVPFPVREAHETQGRVFVLCDYMAFPQGQPARNFFAYDLFGNLLWRVEDIGLGATDAYTNIISVSPLVVGNFAGFNCTIDIQTGRVLEKTFNK